MADTFAVRLLAPWRGFAAGHLRIAPSEAAARRALDDHVAGAAELVALGAVPASRAFRDCWREAGGVCVVDLTLARAVRLDQIRAIRDAWLAALDVEQLRGREVEAEKQALRDLPETILRRGDLEALSADDLAEWLPPELTR